MFRLAGKSFARSAAVSTRMNVAKPMRFNKFYYSTLPKEDVSKRVIDVVRNFDKIAPNSEISAATNFATDLKLDSLDTVEVLVAIEEEFDIEIEDKDADEIKTVGQAIEYISSNPDAN